MGGGGGGGRFSGTIGAGGALSGGTLYAAAATHIGTDAGGNGGGSAELTFAQAVASGISNFGPSAKSFANDLYEAVTSPKQTAEGLCKIIAGYGCELFGVESDYRAYSDAVTEHFSDRYGSYEKFKQTLATDPVGLAGDISTLFTAGGGALRGLAKAGSLASKTLPAGGAIAKGVESTTGALKRAGTGVGAVGTKTDPLYLPGKAIGKAAGRLPDSVQKKITATPKAGTAASRSKTIVNIGGTEQAIEKNKKQKNKAGE